METKLNLLKEAYDNAYAPYSHFQVGALLVMRDGTFVKGANIENASYGLCNCAERSALFAAYTNGYRKEDILELMILTKSDIPSSPCGACRQVITELMEPDAKVTLYNLDGKVINLKVSDLLPYAFTKDNLENE